MYIISLTILFCVCWMKAEVCNSCATSVTKCINNHCFQTGFPINLLDRLVDPKSLCWAGCGAQTAEWCVHTAQRLGCFIFGGIQPTICLVTYLSHIQLILASKKLHTSPLSMNVSLHGHCCCIMWNFKPLNFKTNKNILWLEDLFIMWLEMICQGKKTPAFEIFLLENKMHSSCTVHAKSEAFPFAHF